ncbi:putative P-type phospholipid transporter [Helianthus debilis subsp. tardiflorus]
MGTGRNKRVHFSKIYSFQCGRRRYDDDGSQIGGPGFSRVVYCNETSGVSEVAAGGQSYYADNYMRSTKYTPMSFFPKSLFEQFRRVANFFFLVTAILSFTDLAPYSAVSAVLPLIVVIAASMIKEGIEDWQRKQQDHEVNNRKVKVHRGEGVFESRQWKKLKVGDIVKVEKDEFFPADLLLLSSSYEDAICYVETMNLDGETNLKLKQSLEATSTINNDSNFSNFKAAVKCEDPNATIPDVDEETGKVTYEAESPDEAAFVIAARELGFEFYKRTQTTVSFFELDPVSKKRVERTYELLNVLEFNSARKRMSVIVKNDDGKLLLLSKGADSVMFARLAKNGREFEENTKKHVNQYADAGLRTLILAYRELTDEEYEAFNEKFTEAKNSVSADRDDLIDEATAEIEKDLILLGATAVEDKLQKGVPECIDKLAQAGIKIWVLTGDKMETAINIGFSCSLLREGMKQITIILESPEIIAAEKEGDENVIAKISKESVKKQILAGKAQLSASTSEAFALIIDGKSLAYALRDSIKDTFLELAVGCASVICCRSSPKQKALVTRLVKEGTGKTTLAIGDGANDVGMLQEADIGIGISGVEGMQAVMSSDIAIAQFRFLERLLLVHGHWCYRRISSMICYFFYKNIVFGTTIFFYEAYASFSGQAAYNDWYLSLYNVFFTSLPAIALGVFDQDVSARFCLKFPLLYQEGVQNTLFRWRRIFGWMLNGLASSVIIFFLCIRALDPEAYNKNGKTAGLEVVGTTIYTCVVWVVNCQMALAVNYFTLIQHIFIWGGIILWYLFLLGYGAMPATISTTAYKVFVETLAPAPSYWFVTLFASIAALIPYFCYNAVQMRFFPAYHGMIQWIRHEGNCEDPEYVQMVRQRSIRTTTVGYTARSIARDNTLSHLNLERQPPK